MQKSLLVGLLYAILFSSMVLSASKRQRRLLKEEKEKNKNSVIVSTEERKRLEKSKWKLKRDGVYKTKKEIEDEKLKREKEKEEKKRMQSQKKINATRGEKRIANPRVNENQKVKGRKQQIRELKFKEKGLASLKNQELRRTRMLPQTPFSKSTVQDDIYYLKTFFNAQFENEKVRKANISKSGGLTVDFETLVKQFVEIREDKLNFKNEKKGEDCKELELKEEKKTSIDINVPNPNPGAAVNVAQTFPLTSTPVVTSNPAVASFDLFDPSKNVDFKGYTPVLEDATKLFMNEPTCLDLDLSSLDLLVVGDLRGSLQNLKGIFKTNGYPGSLVKNPLYSDMRSSQISFRPLERAYLFLGNYLDDQEGMSITLFTWLCAWKREKPRHVFMLRGALDTSDILSLSGASQWVFFKQEQYYSSSTISTQITYQQILNDTNDLFTAMVNAMDALSLVAVIDEHAVAVHGHLRSTADLAALRVGYLSTKPLPSAVDDPCISFILSPPQNEDFDDLNDFVENMAVDSAVEEKRVTKVKLSHEALLLKDLYLKYGINTLIKAHQVLPDGQIFTKYPYGGAVYSVFSCRHYRGSMCNGSLLAVKPCYHPGPGHAYCEVCEPVSYSAGISLKTKHIHVPLTPSSLLHPCHPELCEFMYAPLGSLLDLLKEKEEKELDLINNQLPQVEREIQLDRDALLAEMQNSQRYELPVNERNPLSRICVNPELIKKSENINESIKQIQKEIIDLKRTLFESKKDFFIDNVLNEMPTRNIHLMARALNSWFELENYLCHEMSTISPAKTRDFESNFSGRLDELFTRLDFKENRKMNTGKEDQKFNYYMVLNMKQRLASPTYLAELHIRLRMIQQGLPTTSPVLTNREVIYLFIMAAINFAKDAEGSKARALVLDVLSDVPISPPSDQAILRSLPGSKPIVVVGQLNSLDTLINYVFKNHEYPGQPNTFIFTGDYFPTINQKQAQSKDSFVLFTFLCALKLMYPDYVYMLAGAQERSIIKESVDTAENRTPVLSSLLYSDMVEYFGLDWPSSSLAYKALVGAVHHLPIIALVKNPSFAESKKVPTESTKGVSFGALVTHSLYNQGTVQDLLEAVGLIETKKQEAELDVVTEKDDQLNTELKKTTESTDSDQDKDDESVDEKESVCPLTVDIDFDLVKSIFATHDDSIDLEKTSTMLCTEKDTSGLCDLSIVVISTPRQSVLKSSTQSTYAAICSKSDSNTPSIKPKVGVINVDFSTLSSDSKPLLKLDLCEMTTVNDEN